MTCTIEGYRPVPGTTCQLPHTGGVDAPLVGPVDVGVLGAAGLVLVVAGLALKRLVPSPSRQEGRTDG